MSEKNQVTKELNLVSCDGRCEQEIADFLQALSSYPECFATNPDISFEEYFSSIAAKPMRPSWAVLFKTKREN